jgi:hypothetical protein
MPNGVYSGKHVVLTAAVASALSVLVTLGVDRLAIEHRVTVIEEQEVSLKQSLDDIRTDIRDIKTELRESRDPHGK